MKLFHASGHPRAHDKRRETRNSSGHHAVLLVVEGVIFLSSLVILAAAAAQAPLAETQLALFLSTDSTRWAVTDTVRITLIVKNVSAAPVLFFARHEGSSVDFVSLRAGDGTVLHTIPKVLRRPPVPSQGDFLSLGSGEEWSFGLSGLVCLQELTDYGTRGAPVIRGLFLDFGDSAIHIPGPGKYTLTGHFTQREYISRVLENWFNLAPLWHGAMISSSVAIEVP